MVVVWCVWEENVVVGRLEIVAERALGPTRNMRWRAGEGELVLNGFKCLV